MARVFEGGKNVLHKSIGPGLLLQLDSDLSTGGASGTWLKKQLKKIKFWDGGKTLTLNATTLEYDISKDLVWIHDRFCKAPSVSAARITFEDFINERYS